MTWWWHRAGSSSPSGGIADLFPGPGMWFDISDHSTLWQDLNGTTPATTNGAPVRRISDKSGNGHDLIAQETGVATLTISGGRSYIVNSNFRWEAPSAVGLLRNVNAVTTIIAARDGGDANGIIFFTIASNNNGRHDVRFVGAEGPRVGGAGQFAAVYASWNEGTITDPCVIHAVQDFSGGLFSMSVNGGTPKTASPAGNAPTPNDNSQRVAIFGSASSGSPFGGRFYGGFTVPRLLSPAEATAARAEVSALIGL